jgi:hypothetical protein
MPKLLKTEVKPASIRLVLLGIALVVTLNILMRFSLLPTITSYQPDIITIIGSLFLMSEVAVMSMIRGGKGLNVVDMVIALIAGLSLLGVVLSFFGMSVAMLSPLQGMVDVGLLIFVVVEIFRKN